MTKQKIITTREEIADKIFEMMMNGGRGKVHDYLASQGVNLDPRFVITDIGCDFTGGWFLVAHRK